MKKKQILSITIFIIGIIALITGIVFLVLRFTGSSAVQDGEYLISAKEWTLEDGTNCADEATNCAPSVIWKFTEIGKGTLTTNNHTNDYDFIWAIEDGTLKIETSWLYDLENEYQYQLDQSAGVLTLTDGDTEYKFVAAFEEN